MWMDILNASRKYVERLCSSIEGLKVLLLDHETVNIHVLPRCRPDSAFCD